jgi:sulfur-oxidizing protein SoxY
VARRRLLGLGAHLAPMAVPMLWPLVGPWPALAQAPQPASGNPDADPLNSPFWPSLRQAFLGGAVPHWWPELRVLAPARADDAMNVPVLVDASALLALGSPVRRLRLVADHNPVRHVLDFEPLRAWPVLGLRLRLEQASPVRALVQTEDGQWHMGGTWVQAAGGGCTVAAPSRQDGSWQHTLNQVQARWFTSAWPASQRLRLRVMHPMDTGLVPGIPAFHLEDLALLDGEGQPCWRLALQAPVAENPLFTLEMRGPLPGPLRLRGRDNNGNPLQATLPRPVLPVATTPAPT